MMLVHLTVNLVLSALLASQAHGGPVISSNVTVDSTSALLAEDFLHGCGLLIDDMGIGHIMSSGGSCGVIERDAESINLIKGCFCVLFKQKGCRLDEPESWRKIMAGPAVNFDLKGNHVKWYQCTTDLEWSQVSATLHPLRARADNPQGWMDRFINYWQPGRKPPAVYYNDGAID